MALTSSRRLPLPLRLPALFALGCCLAGQFLALNGITRAQQAPAPAAPAASRSRPLAVAPMAAKGTASDGKKSAPGQWDIDFTPRYCEIQWRERSGRVLYLQNGPLRIFLDIPAGWEASGDKGALLLKRRDGTFGRIELRATETRLPVPMTPEWAENSRKRLVKFAAPEARDIQFLEQKEGPLDVNNWRSFEQRFTYSFFGDAITYSICHLRLSADYDLELICTARSQDFAAAHAAAFSMMSSWNMPPANVLQQMVVR